MPQPKPKLAKAAFLLSVKERLQRLSIRRRIFAARLREAANRRTFAYLFMLSFILLTSVGAGLIFPPAGLIVAGITCGLFGFLLGTE